MGSSFLSLRLGFREIVMHDLPECEREIGDDMDGRHHFQDWQLGDRGQRMRAEVQGCGTGPGTLSRSPLR